MEKEVNEEKRKKFIEYAGKRVNNVLHGIQILEPMARSNTYDFTRKDVEDMFNAMQTSLNDAREEFERKFNEKSKAEKKLFSFASEVTQEATPVVAGSVIGTEEVVESSIESVVEDISKDVNLTTEEL